MSFPSLPYLFSDLHQVAEQIIVDPASAAVTAPSWAAGRASAVAVDPSWAAEAASAAVVAPSWAAESAFAAVAAPSWAAGRASAAVPDIGLAAAWEPDPPGLGMDLNNFHS